MWLLPSSKIEKPFLPAPDYEQQIRITYAYGGDQVMAGRRELHDSDTHVMVADEVYNDRDTDDLLAAELTKARKSFAAVDVHLSSDEGFHR